MVFCGLWFGRFLLCWSLPGCFSGFGLFCGLKSDFARCDRSDCFGSHSPCISGQLMGLGTGVGIGDSLGVIVGDSVGVWFGMSIGQTVGF